MRSAILAAVILALFACALCHAAAPPSVDSTAGAASASSSGGGLPYDAFSELKACETHGQYYSAFKVLPAALKQMQNEDPTAFVTEGGTGNFEYDHLLMITAVSGERDWLRILKDPDIALAWKHDLIDWISDAALAGNYTAKGTAANAAGRSHNNSAVDTADAESTSSNDGRKNDSQADQGPQKSLCRAVVGAFDAAGFSANHYLVGIERRKGLREFSLVGRAGGEVVIEGRGTVDAVSRTVTHAWPEPSTDSTASALSEFRDFHVAALSCPDGPS